MNEALHWHGTNFAELRGSLWIFYDPSQECFMWSWKFLHFWTIFTKMSISHEPSMASTWDQLCQSQGVTVNLLWCLLTLLLLIAKFLHFWRIFTKMSISQELSITLPWDQLCWTQGGHCRSCKVSYIAIENCYQFCQIYNFHPFTSTHVLSNSICGKCLSDYHYRAPWVPLNVKYWLHTLQKFRQDVLGLPQVLDPPHCLKPLYSNISKYYKTLCVHQLLDLW